MKPSLINQNAGAIVLYSLNAWENALPIVRVIGPALQAGFQVFPGNRMETVSARLVSLADLVVIQRDFPRLTRHYLEIRERARIQGKPLIYDLDDLLLDLPDWHPDSQNHYYRDAYLPIMQAMLDADLVTTSSLPLKEYAENFNLHTALLPNYLNDSIWPLRSPRPVDRARSDVVIGYIGSSTHQEDIESIAPALTNLLVAHSGKIFFKFWGAKPPTALQDHPQVAWEPLWIYDYSRYAAYLVTLDCDVVIAPMQDNWFNRHKSALKFFEYSASGWPGVYSRITPYQAVVQPGINGFLADTPQEWYSALEELITQPERRWQIAHEAQKTVRASWLLSGHTAELQQVYHQVLSNLPRSNREKTAFNLKKEQALIRVRAAIAPPGSRREQVVMAPGRAVQIVETEGVPGVARRLRETLSGGPSGSQASTPQVNPFGNAKISVPIPDSARTYLELRSSFQESAAEQEKFSIVILSYNNINYTRLCLKSILAESRDRDYEIIVVDNASSDGTPAFLQDIAAANPAIKLILNQENLGFASGNNQGASAASGKFLIFLNNDTVVTPGWLSSLAKYLCLPEVGMVGPVTNASGNESCIDVSYRNMSEMREFAQEYTRAHAGKAFEIPMLAFLCVALRREVFEEVGPLDNQFGLGMFEDDDYAIRIKLKGYRIICAQDAFIHHWGSASFSRLPGKLFYQLFNENRRKFEKKWGNKWSPYRLRRQPPTG